MSRIQNAKQEAQRVRGPVVLLLLSLAVFLWVGISRTNLETIVYKIALVCIGILMAHFWRRRIFGYIHIEEAIHGTGSYAKVPVSIRAVVLAGAFVLYVAILLALIWAA